MVHHFEEPPITETSVKFSLSDPKSTKKRGSLMPGLIQAASTSFRDDDSEELDKSEDFSVTEDLNATFSSEDFSICSSESEDIAEIEEKASHGSESEASEASKVAGYHGSFTSLRITYLLVTLVVMLADGLQGTHLYVLYEGYGFNVATLYCLGFVTGGLASPITGPLVDKLGRKKSALLYCALEIAINRLEQYPILAGLIISRMVGGITTNLLSTVFDAWLDTEYRNRGLKAEGYEIIMRDSVIVSNLAAIGSGYLAHILAESYGPKGPFEGAVACTSMALIVIMFLWTENYGCGDHQVKKMREFMDDAVSAFKADSKVLRLGIIQGLTCASIHIFIFLWSPALRHFAESAPKGSLGLDSNGEPAYGLIFGAFMAAGVLGGLMAPYIRRFSTAALSQIGKDGEQTNDDRIRSTAMGILSSLCYLTCAFLLLLPCLLNGEGTNSFSICLVAFVVYEFIVGLYLPCEGVLRSIYFPAEGRASILTLPRIIVNVGVSVGVASTNIITMRSTFSLVFILMVVSAVLQLSLVADVELSVGFSQMRNALYKVLGWASVSMDDVSGANGGLDTNLLCALVPQNLEPAETDESDSESSYDSDTKVHVRVTKLKTS